MLAAAEVRRIGCATGESACRPEPQPLLACALTAAPATPLAAGPAAAAAPQRAAAPGRRSLLAAAGGGGSGGDAGHGSGPPASANSPPLDNTYDDYNILKGDLADSNAGFLLKLVALSFAGGAAIK